MSSRSSTRIEQPAGPAEWLTSEGLGQYLGTISSDGAVVAIPAATIRNWRHIGKGPPYVKFGGAVRYSRAAVDSWVAAGGDRPQTFASAMGGRPVQRLR